MIETFHSFFSSYGNCLIVSLSTDLESCCEGILVEMLLGENEAWDMHKNGKEISKVQSLDYF